MRLALALCLTVAGCSSLHQPPPTAAALHRAAKARITYQNYAAHDYRVIPGGTVGAGNCATFAFTVLSDANTAGLPARLVTCRLPDGRGHAYTQLAGAWASDVRWGHLVPLDAVGCR